MPSIRSRSGRPSGLRIFLIEQLEDRRLLSGFAPAALGRLPVAPPAPEVAAVQAVVSVPPAVIAAAAGSDAGTSLAPTGIDKGLLTLSADLGAVPVHAGPAPADVGATLAVNLDPATTVGTRGITAAVSLPVHKSGVLTATISSNGSNSRLPGNGGTLSADVGTTVPVAINPVSVTAVNAIGVTSVQVIPLGGKSGSSSGGNPAHPATPGDPGAVPLVVLAPTAQHGAAGRAGILVSPPISWGLPTAKTAADGAGSQVADKEGAAEGGPSPMPEPGSRTGETADEAAVRPGAVTDDCFAGRLPGRVVTGQYHAATATGANLPAGQESAPDVTGPDSPGLASAEESSHAERGDKVAELEAGMREFLKHLGDLPGTLPKSAGLPLAYLLVTGGLAATALEVGRRRARAVAVLAGLAGEEGAPWPWFCGFTMPPPKE